MNVMFNSYKVVQSVEDWVREVIDRNEVDVVSEESLFESKLLLEAIPVIGADKMSSLLDKVKNFWNKCLIGGYDLILSVVICYILIKINVLV